MQCSFVCACLLAIVKAPNLKHLINLFFPLSEKKSNLKIKDHRGRADAPLPQPAGPGPPSGAGHLPPEQLRVLSVSRGRILLKL